jgi:ACT domain-containing protein
MGPDPARLTYYTNGQWQGCRGPNSSLRQGLSAIMAPLQTAPRAPMSEKSTRVIVTVIGADKVGIIAGVSAVLAEGGANIIDISQTTLRDFFAMIMMVDLAAATVPFDELKRRLIRKGEEMQLRIDAQHEDVFKFMHRI